MPLIVEPGFDKQHSGMAGSFFPILLFFLLFPFSIILLFLLFSVFVSVVLILTAVGHPNHC